VGYTGDLLLQLLVFRKEFAIVEGIEAIPFTRIVKIKAKIFAHFKREV